MSETVLSLSLGVVLQVLSFLFSMHRASEVMVLVRGLADNGACVCATIHSPSTATFKLFHSVMVLLRGGVVYFGPAGKRAQ